MISNYPARWITSNCCDSGEEDRDNPVSSGRTSCKRERSEWGE